MVAYKPYTFKYIESEPGPEYGVQYFKKADRNTPFNHMTWKWIRIYNLPGARRKALGMIASHQVMEDANVTILPKGTLYVELFKDGGEGLDRKLAGVVVKVHGKYYWKGINGGYHILHTDGTIDPKTVDVPGMPKTRKAVRRK